jgi:hypothetical protein
MHILKNTQGTLSVVFDAGYATGAVAVAVVDANGNAVASGNATQDNATVGRYTLRCRRRRRSRR